MMGLSISRVEVGGRRVSTESRSRAWAEVSVGRGWNRPVGESDEKVATRRAAPRVRPAGVSREMGVAVACGEMVVRWVARARSAAIQ